MLVQSLPPSVSEEANAWVMHRCAFHQKLGVHDAVQEEVLGRHVACLATLVQSILHPSSPLCPERYHLSWQWGKGQ